MRASAALLVLALAAPLAQAAQDPDYVKSVQAWRERAEKSLRADNGWLTLAGRYVLKPGTNTFGTGPKNDIVFPKGLGPERIGTIRIEFSTVTLTLDKGITMKKDGQPFTERVLGTNVDKRDWVTLGRLAMHVIERDGRFVLRLADNQSEVRKRFRARLWYDVKEPWLVDAKYFPYPKGKTITIINVLDEASEEPAPGYVEFTLDGKTHRLDAVGDDEGLFFVFRDGTSGDTTYKPSRFLYIEKKPEPGKAFKIDFNRAYNPPCAFSEFTTCPLPPKQNILDVRIEAGEKYPPRKAAG
jgi:uncharacterized protein (DUF1684 family)